MYCNIYGSVSPIITLHDVRRILGLRFSAHPASQQWHPCVARPKDPLTSIACNLSGDTTRVLCLGNA
jgi:hypothetical protein